jgi:hypothetical protein
MRRTLKKITPSLLAQQYEMHAPEPRTHVHDLRRLQGFLEKLDSTFRHLLADENFVTLLRAENLARVPTALKNRIMGPSAASVEQCPATGSVAASLVESKNLCAKTVRILSRMNAARRDEVALLMLAAGCYTGDYAVALISATPLSLIVCPRARVRIPMNRSRQETINKEITVLADGLHKLRGLSGSDLLTLQVSCRYIERLLANPSVKTYLGKGRLELRRDLEDLLNDQGQCAAIPQAAQATKVGPKPTRGNTSAARST